MNSDEPLTRIAIESLRAMARAPAPPRAGTPQDPAARLELLNAILLRDQDAAAAHDALRRPAVRGPTRL